MKKIVLLMMLIAGAAFACPNANGDMVGCGCMAPTENSNEEKKEHKCNFEKEGQSCSAEKNCQNKKGE